LNAALDLVKYIKAQGARIDGVGLQAHFIVGGTPSKSALKQAIAAFSAEVDEVAYTELDIRHRSLPASASAKTQQSTDYQTVVSACLESPKCVGVTLWDFADQVRIPTTTFLLYRRESVEVD
jgi:endo-1,4-beta-xylanase